MRRIAVLAALIVVFGVVSDAQSVEPQRLSYQEFLQKAEDGQVKSVTLGPLHYLAGTYLQGKVETEFFSQRPLDAGNDPLLNKLLETQQVSVVKQDQHSGRFKRMRQREG